MAVLAPPTHVLIVEDEPAVRKLLRDFFESEGFVAHEAGNGNDALGALKAHPVNLVTLDVKLAGDDGLALLRDIRTRADIPVVMISAKADEIDRIVGLELGADDYIVKPFNLREVLARIRAVLRRYDRGAALETGVKRAIVFGDFVFDITSRELRRSTRELVQLTTAEFNLLEIFVRRPARILARDVLLDLLNGNTSAPFDRSIDTLVARIRKKIEPDVDNPVYIKTVRGVGYVFAAPGSTSGGPPQT